MKMNILNKEELKRQIREDIHHLFLSYFNSNNQTISLIDFGVLPTLT
jgi:hypothetical protein